MGSKITLIRLQSGLTRWARQLTWPWLASFALVATCLGIYLTVVLPMRHSVNDLKAQLQTMLKDQDSLQQATLDKVRRAPSGQLDAFNSAFPHEDSVPDTIDRLLELAQNKGLDPKQAEYRIVRNNPGDLLSYQITLPIKGPYPKILAFIFDLLANQPNLSLDNISFQRQKIGENAVEATLLMTLYIQRGHSVEQ